jgi:hypothetical protein
VGLSGSLQGATANLSGCSLDEGRAVGHARQIPRHPHATVVSFVKPPKIRLVLRRTMASTGTAPARVRTGSGSDASQPTASPSLRRGKYWICWIVSMIALWIGGATLLGSRSNSLQSVNDDARLNNSAPFRDGMYSGKLAAEHGAALHPATGRWSIRSDRASFIAGYQRGYSETLATRPTTTTAQVE